MTKMTPELKREILALKQNDLTVSFLTSKIGKTTSTQKTEDGSKTFNVTGPEWDVKTPVHLDAGEYINTTAIDTTIGRILANKILIEGNVDKIIPNGFVNAPITQKCFKDLMSIISSALMQKKIALSPNVLRFIQNYEFYGLMLSSALCPSFTRNMMSVNPNIRELRDRMFAEAGGATGMDLNTAVHIEDALVAAAAKALEGDPGMALYDCGARGSFGDNYKMMSIMFGPVLNPATGKYDIVQNNLIDGLGRSDIPALGNSIVNGAYPKAVGTAEGGYITKQFYSVFQSIKLDERGTDCGSKGYLTVVLTPDNYAEYEWQYVANSNGTLTLLNDDSKDIYMNQKINLRSPIGCLSDKICNKCMGERYYILGIENAGLTAGRLPNSILNAGMKAFHTTKVKFYKVDADDLLI